MDAKIGQISSEPARPEITVGVCPSFLGVSRDAVYKDNVEHRCIPLTANVFELKAFTHSAPVNRNEKINVIWTLEDGA